MTRSFAVAAVWLATIAGAIALIFAGNEGTTLAGGGFFLPDAGAALAVVANGSVGAVLTLRRPGNLVGRLLMLGAILITVTVVGFTVGAVLAQVRGRHDLLAGIVALFFALGVAPALIVAGPLVALIFPDGRLPGPRWRWPVGVMVAAISIGSAIVAVRPGPIGGSLADNPLGVSALSGDEGLWAAGLVLILAAVPFAIVLALGALIVRFRRSDGVERAQLKWFVAASAVVGVLLPLSIVDSQKNSTIVDFLAASSLSLPPLAVGVAILRYRLFDIDVIINRTIVYGLATAILAGSYAALVGLFQKAFVALTGSTSDAAIVLTTLIVVSLFTPVKNRLQGVVDRRFKEGTDPTRVLLALVEAVELRFAPLDPDFALARLLRVACTAFDASGGSVRLVSGGITRIVATMTGAPLSRNPAPRSDHLDSALEVSGDSGLGMIIVALGARNRRAQYRDRDRKALATAVTAVADALTADGSR